MLEISKNQLLYKQQNREEGRRGSLNLSLGGKQGGGRTGFNELEDMYQQAATREDYQRVEEEYRRVMGEVRVEVDYGAMEQTEV